MFGMTWKEWLILLLLGAFAAVGGYFSGLRSYTEMENQFLLNDALKSGQLEIHK